MTLIVTGAAGFVGSLLAARLVAENQYLSQFGELILVDRQWRSKPHACARYLEADLANPLAVDVVASLNANALVHLASMPGGAAEADFDAGWRANVAAPMAMMNALRRQRHPPRFVFASSVGVFGAPMSGDTVTDDTYPRPSMSYGAEKLLLEIVIADMSRRGWLDGVSIRLPGIVARPSQPTGHVSAFMSMIFHTLSERKEFTCPVSRSSTCWFMSVRTCIDNILHALALPSPSLAQSRAFNLPALRLTIPELADAIGRHLGADVGQFVNYSPIPQVQAQFGSYPPLVAAHAESLGFVHDGSADALVANVLFPSQSEVSR